MTATGAARYFGDALRPRADNGGELDSLGLAHAEHALTQSARSAKNSYAVRQAASWLISGYLLHFYLSIRGSGPWGRVVRIVT